MKVAAHKNKPSFNPFTLVLEITTEEEARALFAIFNYSHNSKLLHGDAAKRIRDAIGEEYWASRVGEVIANGITYEDYFRILPPGKADAATQDVPSTRTLRWQTAPSNEH